MNILDKINKGEPVATIGTDINFSTSGIANLITGLAILAVIIILLVKIMKKI